MLRSIGNRIRPVFQRHEAWISLGVVLLLGLLAYTSHIGRLGFYRDDWYSLWVASVFGPRSIIDLFTFDRPLVGYIYSGTNWLLGDNPLFWQIYSLGIRTLGSLGFLWMLRRLWPDHKLETTTAAVLFFIYPGFLQWANANTKSNQITTYTLSLFSICLTVAAFQARKLRWKAFFTISAAFSGILYWFLYEYMIGMEGMRLALITILVWRESAKSRWRKSLARVMQWWLPYAIPLGLTVIWRLFYFESGRTGMNVQLALTAYQPGPLRTILKRVLVLCIDLIDALISAWVVPLNDITFHLEPTEFLMAILLSLIGIGAFTAYFNLASGLNPDRTGGNRMLIEFSLLGAITLLFTLTPVIAVGRDIRWDSGYDKYALHVIAGVVMLIVGTTSLIVRGKSKLLIYSLLIGLALATQYGNSVQWAGFWDDQKDLWWQLNWRAPQLKEGTVLLIEPPGMDFFEDYEVWGPANLIYAPAAEQPLIYSEVFSPSTLEKIRVGTTETRGLREFLSFTRSFSNSLIVSRPDRVSCWHIMDGSDPVFPADTSAMLYATVRRSSQDQILVDAKPNLPPERIFGAEPDHGWCFYFQTASLEAQRGNWEGVTRLADQALQADLKPIDRSEWLPFLKGLVMTGRAADAQEMALWIRDIPVIRHRQCDYMSATSLPDPARQGDLRELLCK